MGHHEILVQAGHGGVGSFNIRGTLDTIGRKELYEDKPEINILRILSQEVGSGDKFQIQASFKWCRELNGSLYIIPLL